MRAKTYILAVALVLGLCTAGLAESASLMLEKGIFEEETKGDLDAAIAVYKQIIEDAQANRQYIAQAHYRLGMCYLKKGEKGQAAKAFRQLAKLYPDQTKLVVRAEDELAKLKPRPIGYLPLNKVVERAVYDDGSGKEFMIDLDTGRVFSPPIEEMKRANKGLEQWLTEAGIDALGETKSSVEGLMGVDMIVIPIANERWNLSLNDAREAVSLGKPGRPVLISGKGKLPTTYIFQTREGSVGVLQILEVVTSLPRHIKIQYKLLEHGTQLEPVIRKVFIPDGDIKGIGVILDLASGEMLNNFGNMEYYVKLGKGDLAFDGALVCMRGARANSLTDGKIGPLKALPQQHERMIGYRLGQLPMRVLVSTAENRKFDVKVLSAENGGINIEYKELLASTTKKQVGNARTVAEAFLAAAVAGRGREAIKLTDPASAVPQQVREFGQLPDAEKLRIVTVFASDKIALAITTQIKADHGREGPLTIKLIKQRGLWIVTDIDVRTADKASNELAEFTRKYPNAVELRPIRSR